MRQEQPPAGKAYSRLLRSSLRYGLPIIGSALLIWWVSEGLPPRVWRLLGWTLWHWESIWTRQGNGAIWPLTVLLTQSLLLATAWGVLLWVALGEIMYALQIRRSSKTEAQLPAEQAPVPLEQPAPSTVPIDKDNKYHVHRRPSTRLPGRLQMGSFFTQTDLPDNPFEGEEDEATASSHTAAKRQYTDKTRVVTPLSNTEAEQARDEENPFIFGNPFEGPLPEVFSYDLELQRSMQEITQEVQRQEHGRQKR